MAKILVVDDDPECAALLEAVCQEMGHDVVSAQDGESALRKVRSEAFDVVVTDVLMPEKDGLELLREIRQELPGVKVIAISGGGLLYAEDCLRMAKTFGASQVMLKPLDVRKLQEAIKSLLGESPQ